MSADSMSPRGCMARPVCRIGIFLAILLAVIPVTAPPAAAGTKPVAAKSEMVVAAHPLAAQSALRILDSGGNAVDAAIAAQMVLLIVFITGFATDTGNGSARGMIDGVFWCTMFGTLLLNAPLRAVGGLSAELDARTMDLLLLTRLDAWRIVWGKWVSLMAQTLLLLVALLVFIAYILLADRKIWAAVQLRRGPNVVGPWGLFQSFADLLKFVFKEPVIPATANKVIFLLAPLVSVTLALATWAVVPLNNGWVIANINVGILYIFAISSLEVYGIIMGGWASNSKYPFLGALRSAAQMVSYEVSIGFVIVTVLLCVGSLNLTDIVMSQSDGLGTRLGLPASFLDWHWLALFPMFVVFFISALAETNRPPFDLPEAESELVAGFMVEYGSTPYMMFMLGEYAAIVLMCSLTTILFLGGWLPPVDIAILNWVPGIIWFVLKATMVFFMFAMVKAFVPRYRYDQLMRLGWKVFLPISLAMVIITAFVLKLMGWA